MGNIITKKDVQNALKEFAFEADLPHSFRIELRENSVVLLNIGYGTWPIHNTYVSRKEKATKREFYEFLKKKDFSEFRYRAWAMHFAMQEHIMVSSPLECVRTLSTRTRTKYVVVNRYSKRVGMHYYDTTDGTTKYLIWSKDEDGNSVLIMEDASKEDALDYLAR